MAHVLIIPWFAVLLLCGGTAWAMGPKAPFSPPGKESVRVPAELAAASAAPVGSGLMGLRFGAQPQALIDGGWVRVGQTVRGARLAQLLPQHALLIHPDGRRERLPLFPVEAPAAPASAASGAETPPNDSAASKKELP